MLKSQSNSVVDNYFIFTGIIIFTLNKLRDDNETVTEFVTAILIKLSNNDGRGALTPISKLSVNDV
ncbi:MAG: hypothetical protein HRT53_14195 [Colwellia sp.]|nr:hypothetical protein [Colwellia sp.]